MPSIVCLCVHAYVCVCERTDRLLAESLVIQGCFHVAVCVGDEEEVCFKHVRVKSVFSGAYRRVINRQGECLCKQVIGIEIAGKSQMKMGENNL